MSSCHVSCCRLDYQRPLGEDFDHPDDIVWYQRVVANLMLGVLRLHRRPVFDKDRFWGYDVTYMEGELANMQQTLRVHEDERDQGTGHWVLVRLQQLMHQYETLIQNRNN